MSTLHERLAAELTDLYTTVPAALPWNLIDAVRAVVELHAPRQFDGRPCCYGCDRGESAEGPPLWPCRTIDSIADALGVETGETP